jgi:hypothetical protein
MADADDPDKAAKPSKSLDAADIALLKTYVRGAPPAGLRPSLSLSARAPPPPPRCAPPASQGAGPYAARIKALENALEEELKVRREAESRSARVARLALLFDDQRVCFPPTARAGRARGHRHRRV